MSHSANIAFVTLGCAKNEVDTDKMQALLSAAGYAIVDDAAQADLAIVNTCAFLASAVEESLEVVFDLAGQRGVDGERLKVLVAGCMPARYGNDLGDELVEAAGFLPASQEDEVVAVVQGILGDVAAGSPADDGSLRHDYPASAYVKVSDGCDRFCSYCMIPYIRGRYCSYPLDQIDAEVTELVDAGVREIVLIGQDTGIWGRDLETPSSISELLSTLARRHPDTWFRLMYVQPEGIDDELLGVIAGHPNVCSYIDMPLQHADADVLARMNRTGSAPQILELVEHVRAVVPDVLIRTTLMAGFPGETEEQFEALLDFVEEAQFDYAGVFAYSPEEGSAAYSFDGLLADEERMERAQRLMDACEAIGVARLTRLVGTTAQALVEGYEQTDVGLEALCRTQGQAPDVDGQTHVPVASADELEIGQIVDVDIVGSFFYELEGVIANDGR